MRGSVEEKKKKRELELRKKGRRKTTKKKIMNLPINKVNGNKVAPH